MDTRTLYTITNLWERQRPCPRIKTEELLSEKIAELLSEAMIEINCRSCQSLLGGVFAQRAHSASYYGVYPGNSPDNLPPLEACMSVFSGLSNVQNNAM